MSFLNRDKTMEKLKNYILDKIFVISVQPVLFGDLLEANALFNEGMHIDPAKLNFKFNYFYLYLFYAIICLVCLIVGFVVLHSAFVALDAHISIVSTAIITAAIFVGFDVFKIWARKAISAKQIKKAWELHFAYFEYEKYNKIVESIYSDAMKDEISRKDLEKFVLERLVSNAGK